MITIMITTMKKRIIIRIIIIKGGKQSTPGVSGRSGPTWAGLASQGDRPRCKNKMIETPRGALKAIKLLRTDTTHDQSQ